MNGAAILFFAVLAAGIATASALALLLRSRLRRRHRVHPKVRTDAPVTWLADPRTATGARSLAPEYNSNWVHLHERPEGWPATKAFFLFLATPGA